MRIRQARWTGRAVGVGAVVIISIWRIGFAEQPLKPAPETMAAITDHESLAANREPDLWRYECF